MYINKVLVCNVFSIYSWHPNLCKNKSQNKAIFWVSPKANISVFSMQISSLNYNIVIIISVNGIIWSCEVKSKWNPSKLKLKKMGFNFECPWVSQEFPQQEVQLNLTQRWETRRLLAQALILPHFLWHYTICFYLQISFYSWTLSAHSSAYLANVHQYTCCTKPKSKFSSSRNHGSELSLNFQEKGFNYRSV